LISQWLSSLHRKERQREILNICFQRHLRNAGMARPCSSTNQGATDLQSQWQTPELLVTGGY
jgi:hypothetical protein